jgi:propionate CoA-transferase
MGRIKLITAQEAASLIKDDDMVATVGFLLTGAPEEVLMAIENRYIKEKKPNNIGIFWASGIGDGQRVRGINHLCHEGLINRAIGGHYGLIPRLVEMVNNNVIEAYNYPQGVLNDLFRAIAAGKPGIVTKVGIGTFVDPDNQGGCLNEKSVNPLVEKIHLNGEDYLFYKSQSIDVAIVRGTEADENGNISFRKEALILEGLSVAMAARNSGGIVIVQVEKRVKNGTIHPKDVIIPGAMVDYVVEVADLKNHMQTAGTQFREDYITNTQIISKMNQTNGTLDVRKVIARRAAQQLEQKDVILNFGIGIPEKIAEVLKEQGIQNQFISTVEPGIFGGTAQGGLDFGSSINPEAVIDHPYQFDFYDGGGIDATFLGMAQCDASGSLNVSKFGPKIAGCGGFIDISQNAKKCIFCGTFTAEGLKVEISNKRLKIINEGKSKKFVNKLEHITFNGLYESKKQKPILIITERAVFKVLEQGLTLTEIAPGIDLEKDILNQMEFKPIIDVNLKVMDSQIFDENNDFRIFF